MFDGLIQVVIIAVSESGVVDLRSFKESEDYAYMKDLFETPFLENQLFMADAA